MTPLGDASVEERLPLPAAAERGVIPAVELAWPSAIATRHRARDYVLRRVLALADALGITAAAACAFAVSSSQKSVEDWLLVLPILPVWLILFKTYGLYERDGKRINHGVLDDVPSLLHALVIGTLLMWVYYWVLGVEKLILVEVVIFAVSGLILIPFLRSTSRRLMYRVYGAERVAFIGDDPMMPSLIRKVRTHPEYGLDPVGVVSRGDPDSAPEGLLFLGALEELDIRQLIDRHGIERVIVAHHDSDEAPIPELLRKCGQLSVKVSLLPTHVEVMGPSIEVDDIEGVTVLGLNPLVLSRSSRILKRTMDLTGASVGLLLFAPLIALSALAVWLGSGRPVFFRQERVGRRGQSFRLVKLRTMIDGAELLVPELAKESRDPNWLWLDRDPRVTRVGRVWRAWSIDELPQLWNVIKGEMSLVGPRPLPVLEDERVQGWARSRLDLAPGVTGLWQVLGRTNIPFAEMVKLDYSYVTNWSLWTDIKLVLRTLPTILRQRGAN